MRNVLRVWSVSPDFILVVKVVGEDSEQMAHVLCFSKIPGELMITDKTVISGNECNCESKVHQDLYTKQVD